MDSRKVDAIIQYILAIASQNDDWMYRELGAIHFVKYVYLADLAHAQTYCGETYTGAEWKFHHFGPWNYEVFDRIDPALEAIHANKKRISGKLNDDFFRWSIGAINPIDSLKKQLDFSVALTLDAAVSKYGSDTEELLHYVYTTLPMLKAAPEEILDLSIVQDPACPAIKQEKSSPMSEGRKKRFEAKKKKVRERLDKRLAEYKEKQSSKKSFPKPRYDDVYHKGMEYLDSLSGSEIEKQKLSCKISDEIWKSKARYDPDLP